MTHCSCLLYSMTKKDYRMMITKSFTYKPIKHKYNEKTYYALVCYKIIYLVVIITIKSVIKLHIQFKVIHMIVFKIISRKEAQLYFEILLIVHKLLVSYL